MSTGLLTLLLASKQPCSLSELTQSHLRRDILIAPVRRPG